MNDRSLDQWLDYISSIRPKEANLGLDKIRPIYKKIVNFPLANKVVVVGGTNGKGSTVEFLTQLLMLNNKSVGTFTSPHIFKFNERIRVNGKPVADNEIIDAFQLIEVNRGSSKLTYFDFSTLAALRIFNRLNLDVIILEIGLGGRLDPVNIVDSDIGVLTNVELDHQEWLGKDKEAIGEEKAAIFRSNKTVILGEHEMPKTVLNKTLRLQNKVLKVGRDFEYSVNDSLKEWAYTFNSDQQISLKKLKLGSLSVSSLSCALTAYIALGNKLDLNINAVLDRTHLRGRCELIDGRFLLDVSHNASSAEYLNAFIQRNFSKEIKITAVLGVMEDKDVNSIIKPFAEKVDKWFLTSPNLQRSMRTDELKAHLKLLGDLNSEVRISEIDNVKQACLQAHQETSKVGLILVFGSFYTVSEAFLAINPLSSVA
ncbi:MAG: Mur ligase family protein [Pseudomonadota bacterium]|nr:Mur ligase family protein [Pseudomonadota bacterium]